MSLRQLERRLTRFRDSELEVSVTESLGAIAGVVELLSQSRVHVRDVELLQIVVAVQRPVRTDQVVLRRRVVAHKIVKWHERHPLANGRDPVVERHLRRETTEEE